MQELVQYNNKFNKIQFTNFNSNDLNILMKICVKLNKLNKNDNTKLEITFNELKESIKYVGHKKQFIKLLDSMTDKISIMKIWTDEGFDKIFLFKRCKTVVSREVLKIELNKEYIDFFIELEKQFTAFSLENFVKIQGKYAKNIYRLIMQWKTKGHCPTEYEDKFFSIAEIKGFLNISEDHKVKYLTDDILKPAVKELNELGLIKNLELIVHKAKKRGAPVIGYSFKFTPISIKNLSHEQKDAIKHKKNGTYTPKSDNDNGKSKNKFKNFTERDYTQEDLEDIEKKLLNQNIKKAKEMTPEEIQEYEEMIKNAEQMSLDFGQEQEPETYTSDSVSVLKNLSQEDKDKMLEMLLLNFPDMLKK